MSEVTLTILMSSYNASKYLKKAIDGIIQQTFQDWELLIADDASTDNSWQIINLYNDHPNIRIQRNSSNRGKTATINDLLKAARGRYITIHDADDYSDPGRFERQIGFLNVYPEVVMCGCSFRSFTHDGFEDVVSMSSDFEQIKEKILDHSQFHGPTMVIRREVVEGSLQGEFLRPFFQDYNEDCDLAMRLVEIGICTNLPQVLYHYRVLPGSLSKTVTARKKCLYPMLIHFHKQRLKRGVDDLQQGNERVAQRKLDYLIKKRYFDPSLVFRESAAFYMHYQWKLQAIRAAVKAIKTVPGKFENWRTLQYCLRKWIFHS